MHPQPFLKTFWRLELKPQVFVAMSFADADKPRYHNVIAPAIEQLLVDGVHLKPYRVDTSQTGDSILTDIVDGIAHSRLVLADVTSMADDPTIGKPYRNGNVMYEVGLALACRQPSEVLIIRGDKDPLLFDTSSIPHKWIDFSNKESAIVDLREALLARLKEQNFFLDARVRLALASLNDAEAKVLIETADLPLEQMWGQGMQGGFVVGGDDIFRVATFSRLLDKQLILLAGQLPTGKLAYKHSPLGRVVAQLVKANFDKGKKAPE